MLFSLISLCRAESIRAGCPEISPVRLLVSPQLETSTLFSAQCGTKLGYPYNKEVLLSCLNTICNSICPHCFLSCLWAPSRRARLPLITPSHQVLICIVKFFSHLSLLFPRLNNNNSLNLSLQVRCSRSLITLVAFLAPVCPSLWCIGLSAGPNEACVSLHE